MRGVDARVRRTPLLTLSFLGALACARVGQPSARVETSTETQPTYTLDGQQRARLRTALQERLDAHGVPAAAFALVVGDKVVAIESFGTTTSAGGRAVDGDTLFAIGSTTKTFTAALGAAAVDEGRADWGDPMTDHLPWFSVELAEPASGATLTLEDALSHRSGFTRMTMLWVAGTVERERMLRVATGAEPVAPHRAGFAYNNVMYAAGGDAIAAALGEPWEQAVVHRLFDPLGLRRTNLSAAETLADPNHAQGTFRDPTEDHVEAIPMRTLGTICPAGCVNSSANDMARFLVFVLGRGTVDGRELVGREAFESLWEPRIAAGPRSYGIGWFIRDLAGERLVEHGGNIDGYQSDLRVLPDLVLEGAAHAGVGYVLLTNSTIHPLRAELDAIVLPVLDPERFAGLAVPEPQREASGPALADGLADGLADAVVGEYVGDQGLHVELVIEGGRVVLRGRGVPTLQFVMGDEPDTLRGAGNPTTLALGLDVEGTVQGIELRTPNATYALERYERPVPSEPVRRRFEDTLALDRRAKAEAELGPVRWAGVIRLPSTGIEGRGEQLATMDAVRSEFDYGEFGRGLSVTTPTWGWSDTSFSEPDEAVGVYLRQQWLEHPLASVGDVRRFYDSFELSGLVQRDGRELFEVRASVELAPPETLWFDADTGDLVRRELSLVQKAMGTVPVVVVFEDFVEFGGLRWPTRIVSEDPQRGRAEQILTAPEHATATADSFSPVAE